MQEEPTCLSCAWFRPIRRKIAAHLYRPKNAPELREELLDMSSHVEDSTGLPKVLLESLELERDPVQLLIANLTALSGDGAALGETGLHGSASLDESNRAMFVDWACRHCHCLELPEAYSEWVVHLFDASCRHFNRASTEATAHLALLACILLTCRELGWPEPVQGELLQRAGLEESDSEAVVEIQQRLQALFALSRTRYRPLADHTVDWARCLDARQRAIVDYCIELRLLDANYCQLEPMVQALGILCFAKLVSDGRLGVAYDAMLGLEERGIMAGGQRTAVRYAVAALARLATKIDYEASGVGKRYNTGEYAGLAADTEKRCEDLYLLGEREPVPVDLAWLDLGALAPAKQ